MPNNSGQAADMNFSWLQEKCLVNLVKTTKIIKIYINKYVHIYIGQMQ